jgi:hypothetical protein
MVVSMLATTKNKDMAKQLVVNRRTVNTMANIERTKRQIIFDKTAHKKLKIE